MPRKAAGAAPGILSESFSQAHLHYGKPPGIRAAFRLLGIGKGNGREDLPVGGGDLHGDGVAAHLQTVEGGLDSRAVGIKGIASCLAGLHIAAVFSMYLSGIDTRGGVLAKSRSDVNILATVNVDTRQVLLVSTPRDYYVPLPISNGQPDKLTHAGIYGVDVSMGALEMLYGIDIDYYFRVNFSGFEKIIDALGGITVNSEKSFTTHDGQFYFNKGENRIGGAAALGFVRERQAFSDGDRQRGKNQMEVIRAVIDKAMSPAILTGFTELMESVSGNFETSMPYDLIAELVRDQLENGGSWNIVSTSVSGSDSSGYTYSAGNAYVMVPDQATVDAAIAKINQVKNGEILG